MSTNNKNLFRATHPIDFDLFDKDSQNVLYIEDNSDQLLTLEIRNASNQDIVLKDLGGPPLSATNFHFALRFRPGTLSSTSVTGTKTIQLTTNTGSNWEMLQSRHDNENWDVIYLRKTKDLLLECVSPANQSPGQAVVFNHVGADAAQGARGTRVELVCTNMNYKGSTEPINTTREIHLGIINHRGKKNIPWQLGFVGGNTVVNDGVTPNPLILRIANIAPYSELNPTQSKITFKHDADDATKTTKIFLWFQTGDIKDAWALDTDNNVFTHIDISIDEKLFPGWNIIKPKESKKPVWILSPQQTINLPCMADPVKDTKSHVDININNVISHCPCGQTNMYISYQNIPGYWDGNEACIIEKTPVKVKQDLVEMFGNSSGENIPFQIVALPKSVGPLMGFTLQTKPDQNEKCLVIGSFGSANNIRNFNRPLLITNKDAANNETQIARFTTDGKVAIGNITQPGAVIDVAPVKTVPALQLQNGNAGAGAGETQIAFGCYDANAKNKIKDIYRHSIKTRHNNSNAIENAIDFYVWQKGKDNPDVIGTLHALSLNNGKAGIGGVTHPSAIVDIAPLKGVPALQLQNGNISTGIGENQIVLGFNDTNKTTFQQNAFRHAIKTRHNDSDHAGNAIDFYVWDKIQDKTIDAIGTLHTMSLNRGKVGINGITNPDATLDVKGDIKCEYIGADPKTIGLTVTNGKMWSNMKGGGFYAGTDKSVFFGQDHDGKGMGIYHTGGGTGGWLISGRYGSETEVTIHGKLFILRVDETGDKSTKWLVHQPNGGEVLWWSDERLKKNITPLPHALDAIQKLRGVSFQWNEEGLLHKTKEVEENCRTESNKPEDNARLWEKEKQRIREENARTFLGFIAQEVEDVFPDWVKKDKDGYRTLNVDELAPVMVEAIKAQQQQINTLQSQIEMLMNEVKALKANSKL